MPSVMGKGNFTNKAVEDLTSIWRYSSLEWSPSQADVYYRAIIDACREESVESSVLAPRDYANVSPGLKGRKARKHIIFYKRVSPEEITVIRILHERMDVKSLSH